MFNKKSKFRKMITAVVAVVMMMSSVAVASADTGLTAGSYNVDATLSCYVNAMGGVEFSDGYGLLESTTVDVAEDGTATATINLGTTSGLSIYGVACTAFIGTDEAPGYYADGAVTTEGVTYTVSDETVANASGQVNYITSITFPVDQNTGEYTMWLYLDSNVMGCQLGDGSGTGNSNTPGVATKHTATLTIDWTTAEGNVPESAPTKTTEQSVPVEYNVEAAYEVEIPATLSVDAKADSPIVSYVIKAINFIIGDGYVTVSANETGTLTDGENELNYTNTLDGNKLVSNGDEVKGELEVEKAKKAGNYTGTVDFVINYFAE